MQNIPSATLASFKNILLLTDFRPSSTKALIYSLALARHFRARLYPAHLLETVFPTLADVGDDKARRFLEEKTKWQLLRLAECHGIGFEPLFSWCEFESAVPSWIAKYGIDLIVVGTHWRSRLQQSLLGSTAEFAVQSALCPVLSIGPHVDVPRQFELAVDKILFPTDLGPQSGAAAAWALALASQRNARLTLLHVLPEESRQYRDRTGVLRFVMEELQKYLPQDGGTLCKPELAVDSGEAAEQILRFARDEQSDLVVMGLPRVAKSACQMRAGVTYRVISSAVCPVLTIRDEVSD
jgi:nucleotide-binding universal stress UspA family protein